ncbi:hypothetical protein TNCV_4906201 [Trichonephila clavipes]|uniref:Uncharacterized protein n=1 Tax=Trichonephila clavipes TaxID=2585209 RepID=A0A8X6RSG4_TRICX|nr:hypothetical protein TNCV_4906201 [Trichonephila clavipes]
MELKEFRGQYYVGLSKCSDSSNEVIRNRFNIPLAQLEEKRLSRPDQENSPSRKPNQLIFLCENYEVSNQRDLQDIRLANVCIKIPYWLAEYLTDYKKQNFIPMDAEEQVLTKIVEVEIRGVDIYRPVGEFRRANSYCHLSSSDICSLLFDDLLPLRAELLHSPVCRRTCLYLRQTGQGTDLKPQLNLMLFYARSFERSKTSGILTASVPASMLDVATYRTLTPTIFHGSPKMCMIPQCSDGCDLPYN